MAASAAEGGFPEEGFGRAGGGEVPGVSEGLDAVGEGTHQTLPREKVEGMGAQVGKLEIWWQEKLRKLFALSATRPGDQLRMEKRS